MTTESQKPLKLFYCYAREDKALRNELDVHLSSLKRQNLLTSWYDGELSPGSEWEKEIDIQLRTAHIILLLVTPHFMASDYCYSVEMKRALERHKAGTARVIPIILRRTFWEDAPFSSLQVLPTDAKPVTQWQDRDEAFWDITVGIHKAVKELHVLLKTKGEWLDESIALADLQRFHADLQRHYEEALVVSDQAIHHDPNNAVAYYNKGTALGSLFRHEEALVALEQAIRLDPNNAATYTVKGLSLIVLMRHEEALVALEQAIRLDPDNAVAYTTKGLSLDALVG